MTTYEAAGVSLSLGDRASAILYEAARQTWKNREGKLGQVLAPTDDFGGLRAIDVSALPAGTVLNMGFDGVGTKVEIAERLKKHHTMAHDLLAMVCDDAVIRGGEPVLVGSILDVYSLGEEGADFLSFVEELARGYVEAAGEANVAIINGELAEMGSRVGGTSPFRYNWGAAVLWFARRERLLTGAALQAGDWLIGLQEEGFRSNGLSLVRAILQEEHGANWPQREVEGLLLGEAVLHPSRIYSRAVVEMTGGVSEKAEALLHGAAHITGGGLPGKLGRLLQQRHLGALIEDPFEPPAIMRYCQRRGHVFDEEAYRVWNMGQGMVLATPEAWPVLDVAARHHLSARVIGRIIPEPVIRLQNRGAFHQQQRWLTFPLAHPKAEGSAATTRANTPAGEKPAGEKKTPASGEKR